MLFVVMKFVEKIFFFYLMNECIEDRLIGVSLVGSDVVRGDVIGGDGVSNMVRVVFIVV